MQVQAKTEENNGFMNDPVPFASGLGNLQTGSSSRPERSETKSQVFSYFDFMNWALLVVKSGLCDIYILDCFLIIFLSCYT